MAPEDAVIDASSLTKFRKLRLKDVNLLDLLINKTVGIALEKGIIKSKSIIVDATHTKSRYNQKSPIEILQDRSKKLRKAVYEIDEKMKDVFPSKNTSNVIEEEITYCQELLKVINTNEAIASYPKVKEKINLLEETVNDDIEHLKISSDCDAMVGHKTADTSFFGYKTHIAMTEERIITAATVSTGEKNDGKELKTLLEKSLETGLEIDTIIGDAAYSEKGNIELATENVAKLNPSVTQGVRKKKMNFCLIKMQECMFVKPVIWRFEKQDKERKVSQKIKQTPTILMLKTVKYVHLKMDAIKMGLKVKLIL